MTLPRTKARWERPDILHELNIAPIERITQMLNRGDEIPAEACTFIERLISRGDALRSAYETRCAVLDDADEV